MVAANLSCQDLMAYPPFSVADDRVGGVVLHGACRTEGPRECRHVPSPVNRSPGSRPRAKRSLAAHHKGAASTAPPSSIPCEATCADGRTKREPHPRGVGKYRLQSTSALD